MRSVETLIIGAGLSGLSTAYHLRRLGRRGVLLVEKEDRVGGRSSTMEKDGFLFDQTGHLLHLHDPYGKKLILRLLGANVASQERSAWIFSNKVFTRYPFQANTYGLPPGVVEDCLSLFVKNRYRPVPLPPRPSFKSWCLSAFGEGISRHFLFPYNLKLWKEPLSKLTADWQGRFMPRPTAEEVLCGALRDQKKFFGYNAKFFYPVRGGIQVLPDAFAERAGEIRLKAPLLSVDLDEKVAVIRGLGEVRYERLVNTMPLAFFLDLALRLPAPVSRARLELRWRDVYNLNVGIAREGLSDKHWIYFPESRFVFYRAGFLTNFSKHAAPKGASSMYIEISRRPGERTDLPRLERQALGGLRACGILKGSDRVIARQWNRIRCAYVLYDRAREGALRTIQAHLRGRGVESIGRWGAWKYSFMEETILDGLRCAERLAGRRAAEPEEDRREELRPLA
ncbi:MAG: FAD-dependent oxidoreductase [Elusimicrobia bacterium]|nr:FAD-dependent oxidoreductase [Elusimicrobiota bacterium]